MLRLAAEIYLIILASNLADCSKDVHNLTDCSEDAHNSHNISLIVMAPFPDALTEGWDRGPALAPAAIVAACEVNNNTNILPGFNLKLIIADDGCSVTSKVTISFLRDIFENKDNQVVGIIGPGCSGTALRVSDFTSRHEVSLIHVTPSATTPQLEDGKRNTTYATISSALSYVQSFIEIMEYNNWENIATLQDEARSYFKQTHSEFLKRVDNSRIIFTESLFASEGESVIPLDSLKDSQARVVMVFAGGDIASQLLCSAYHKDMLYPNFQWIFHDRTQKQLVTNVTTFKVSDTNMNCTEEVMKIATNGVILNQFHLTQENQNATLPYLQKTYEQYNEDYLNELERYVEREGFDNDSPIDYGNSYHDAVWAMALALHNASMNGVDLKTYTFNRNNDTKEIAKHLSRVNFDGASGPIAFQRDTRSSQTVINIKQLLKGEDQLVGTFDRSREERLKFDTTNKNMFISDVYERRDEKIHIALGILTILVTVFLILFMALLQIANTFWYNYHSIKATSPNITHLVFSGCYLFSIAQLILTVQNTFTFSPRINSVLYSVLCNSFSWCFILGYSLIFGTICTKIWRVYRLFRHFRNARPGHCLGDNSLVMFVTILLFMDVAICLTWNLLDPWIINITEAPSTKGTPTLFVHSECHCDHETTWVIAISLYKGMIMILLVVLSIMNRRIKRKDFQHTRKINTLIYGITMLTGVGLPLYFLLQRLSIYIGFVVFSSILLSTVVLSIATLFFPPVLPVLKMKITGELEECSDKSTRRGMSVRSSYSTVDND